MISATALIAKHLGVADWVAVFIKYAAVTALIITPLWVMKKNYDEALVKQGYDACQLETVGDALDGKGVTEEVNLNREVVINETKTAQRSEDTVTRARYLSLIHI